LRYLSFNWEEASSEYCITELGDKLYFFLQQLLQLLMGYQIIIFFGFNTLIAVRISLTVKDLAGAIILAGVLVSESNLFFSSSVIVDRAQRSWKNAR